MSKNGVNNATTSGEREFVIEKSIFKLKVIKRGSSIQKIKLKGFLRNCLASGMINYESVTWKEFMFLWKTVAFLCHSYKTNLANMPLALMFVVSSRFQITYAE